MGWPGRIAGVVIGFLLFFLALGAVLASFGVGEEDAPQSPSPSSVSPTTSPPDVPTSRPAVTETATVTATAVPVPEETVTETVEQEPAEPDPVAPEPVEPEPADPTTAPPADVYYENCDAARAAGAAPVHAGDPGYGPHLDRDGDGVGCEW
ncbi:excalibur calcium-binding domain-containing protein [Streptomyces europaeiscabiei]|uniref:Excalibur calcium-binding domain-containing protein n=2 Tax=Streptomyces europaeiscabiei TaxID=146819 RepID=A0ABU4N981_9ACTN|nr:excalibur calcium-binding domain-containing protein [Streptomyces europaeiscabiei]MDX3699631.1 excalibur calcium-binding domain-containing protein [Streptomyces europaeiscabiei]